MTPVILYYCSEVWIYILYAADVNTNVFPKLSLENKHFALKN